MAFLTVLPVASRYPIRVRQLPLPDASAIRLRVGTVPGRLRFQVARLAVVPATVASSGSFIEVGHWLYYAAFGTKVSCLDSTKRMFDAQAYLDIATDRPSGYNF